RALRGEEDKTAVILVLNTDSDLEQSIRDSKGLHKGCKLPPVFARGKDLVSLIDQSCRWLDANGGDWPQPDPEIVNPKRKGRKKEKSKASIIAEIEPAKRAGMTWREFHRKNNLSRLRNHDDMDEIKRRFSTEPEAEEELTEITTQ